MFAQRSSAERIAQIREALYQSQTWGEFKRRLPDNEWEANLACRWHEDEVPADDEPFVPDAVPGHGDGDYPEWLQQSQLELLPKELIVKYAGQATSSVLNGEFLELPAQDAEAIAEELRALGHTVELTDLDIT